MPDALTVSAFFC